MILEKGHTEGLTLVAYVKSDPDVPVAPVGSLYHIVRVLEGLEIPLRQRLHLSHAPSRQVRTQSAKCVFRACVPNLFRATVNDKRQFHRYSLRVNRVIELQRINSHTHFETPI